MVYQYQGHGGKDAGAISSRIVEKDMNLVLVEKLEKALIEKGAVVFLTRDGDYDLSSSDNNRKRNDLYNRVKLINESNCDMYISMHLNSTNSSKWNGLQIFYSSVNEENKIIAEVITEEIKKNTSNVREVKKNNEYYMYPKIKVPGVLIEAGFISNPGDNYLLRQEDYQDKLINNITEGIVKYFS